MSHPATEWASGSNFYTSNASQLESLFQQQRIQNPSGFAYNQRALNYYLYMPLNIPKPPTLVTIEPNQPSK